MDRQRFTEAATHLGQAAQLSPSEYDLVFNAAVAYRESGQLETAESFYRRTVQIRPMEAGSHLNLGALLHLRGKLEEAEKEYIEAWSLQPGDLTTRTNIQRLHRVMRKKNINITALRDLWGPTRVTTYMWYGNYEVKPEIINCDIEKNLTNWRVISRETDEKKKNSIYVEFITRYHYA